MLNEPQNVHNFPLIIINGKLQGGVNLLLKKLPDLPEQLLSLPEHFILQRYPLTLVLSARMCFNITSETITPSNKVTSGQA